MKIARLLLLAAVVGMSGCDDSGRERPPPSIVRVFNVAPRFDSMYLYRVQRLESNPSFMQSTSHRFDSGLYDFRLEHRIGGPTGDAVVDQEFPLDLSGDVDYMFIVAAPNDEPEIIVSSWPKAFSSTTASRFSFTHANPPLGAVDVYVAAPGSDLSATPQRGTIGFGASTTPFEVTTGVHRIYLTTAGNPGDILYESDDFDIEAGRQAFIVISDGGDQYIEDIILSDIFESLPIRIFAVDETSELRVMQSIDDRLERDVLLNQTTPPLYSALPFGQVSDYASVAEGAEELSITPVGNAGAIEYSEEFGIIPGRRHTILFAGDTSGGLDGALRVDDARSIIGQSNVWFLNGAGLFNSVLIYVTAPGTDVTTVEPTLALSAPDVSARLRFVPNEFELTVRDTATGTTLLGPQPLILEDGGVYTFALVNSAGGSTVDLITLD